MAFADVVSLLQTLESILHPHLEEQQIPHDKEQITSLRETLRFFVKEVLMVSWPRPVVGHIYYLTRAIRDATLKAQDIAEYNISKETKRRRALFGAFTLSRRRSLYEDLVPVARELHHLKESVSKLIESCSAEGWLPTPPQSRQATNRDNIFVGFVDDYQALKDKLLYGPPKLQVIALVGMGGSGKTTLAKKLYGDPFILSHFDKCAWVKMSQHYHQREFLLGLLESMGIPTHKKRHERDDQLSTCLYQHLKDRRYMIILDDVWCAEDWHELRMKFPDDFNGSRIMLTTRGSNVAEESDYEHRMRFLRQDESRTLLCRMVFKEDNCPEEFDEIRNHIVQICKGLPLLIVVIGGQLSQEPRTRGHWERFVQDFNSFANVPSEPPIMEILSTSYARLTLPLRQCFLYMGIFPQGHEIPVTKLINYWVAEGFVGPISSEILAEVAEENLEDQEPRKSETLEEVAEKYLKVLISQNLVLARQTSSNGKVQICAIHDVLRELCMIIANEEKFLNFMTSPRENITNSRRLGVFCEPWRLGPQDFFKEIGILAFLRSLIYTGPPCVDESHDYCCCHLRVIDLAEVDVGTSIHKILMLVHLRYLAFSCSTDIRIPDKPLHYLWHLQTFIIHQTSNTTVYLPTSIGKLTQLRHLQFDMAIFPPPCEKLENLRTLLGVSSSCCSRELFNKTPNFKKTTNSGQATK